ncbi:MAG: hypothetical protein JXQ30_14855 [Spirochaetes bacterium]|nr:hypothetical protein [Spirochaetota bacterium]
MKKGSLLLAFTSIVIAVIVTAAVIISCAAGGEDTEITGLVLFSGHVLAWLSSGGSINHDDFQNPISGGTDITDAAIVITNEDQDHSIPLTYVAGGFGDGIGVYIELQEFPYTAGEKVSASITSGDTHYTGASTQIPDSSTTTIYPEENDNEQPFFLTWEVTAGDFPATHTIVQIMHDDPYFNKWYVLPITQTSYEISGFPVGDSYLMGAFQCNMMQFSGDAQITGYVPADAWFHCIIVNIIK